ncbi:unnamed protein product [Penicillium pancosmium]
MLGFPNHLAFALAVTIELASSFPLGTSNAIFDQVFRRQDDTCAVLLDKVPTMHGFNVSIAENNWQPILVKSFDRKATPTLTTTLVKSGHSTAYTIPPSVSLVTAYSQTGYKDIVACYPTFAWINGNPYPNCLEVAESTLATYDAVDLGSETFMPNPTSFKVAKQPVTPGAAVTAGPHTISLDTNGGLTLDGALYKYIQLVSPFCSGGDSGATSTQPGIITPSSDSGSGGSSFTETPGAADTTAGDSTPPPAVTGSNTQSTWGTGPAGSSTDNGITPTGTASPAGTTSDDASPTGGGASSGTTSPAGTTSDDASPTGGGASSGTTSPAGTTSDDASPTGGGVSSGTTSPAGTTNDNVSPTGESSSSGSPSPADTTSDNASPTGVSASSTGDNASSTGTTSPTGTTSGDNASSTGDNASSTGDNASSAETATDTGTTTGDGTSTTDTASATTSTSSTGGWVTKSDDSTTGLYGTMTLTGWETLKSRTSISTSYVISGTKTTSGFIFVDAGGVVYQHWPPATISPGSGGGGIEISDPIKVPDPSSNSLKCPSILKFLCGSDNTSSSDSGDDVDPDDEPNSNPEDDPNKSDKQTTQSKTSTKTDDSTTTADSSTTSGDTTSTDATTTGDSTSTTETTTATSTTEECTSACTGQAEVTGYVMFAETVDVSEAQALATSLRKADEEWYSSFLTSSTSAGTTGTTDTSATTTQSTTDTADTTTGTSRSTTSTADSTTTTDDSKTSTDDSSTTTADSTTTTSSSTSTSEASATPSIGSPNCAPQDSDHTTIARDDLVEAIRGYCNGNLERKQDNDDEEPYLSNNDKGFPKFWLQIDFSEEQGGCKSAGTYKPTFDDCLDKFTSIVDDCNTDSLDKTGGSQIWSTDQGCIEYSVIMYSKEWTYDGDWTSTL